jgi:hypothetical protein
MPASFARVAISVPTAFARSVGLSPLTSASDAAASVR